MITKFELGDKVADEVTGVSGVITGIVQYLGSSVRYEVTRVVEDKIEEDWFSESRLVPFSSATSSSDIPY